MNEQLFRKKSIERVSSPEQLDAYIRVANPGIWMVLAAIVVLLVGVCVWGVLGQLDTTVPAVAVCEEGTVVLYVAEEAHSSVQTDMEVQIGEELCFVTEVSAVPVAAGETLSDYALHVGGFTADEWICLIRTDAQVPDGIYAAEIVSERVTPMSFVVN